MTCFGHDIFNRPISLIFCFCILTVTISDDGSFNGSDGTGSQGGTWTGDCSQGAPVSATMTDGTQLNGSIVTVSANELSINSAGSMYVFDK